MSTGADGAVRALVSEWNGKTFAPAVEHEPIQRWLGRRGTHAIWSGVPSPDGTFVLLTVSEWSPLEGIPRAADLWVSLKTDAGWSEPRPLKGAVNTGATECFPSLFPDDRQLLFVRDFLTYERVSVERALDR